MTTYEHVSGFLQACAEHWVIIGWLALCVGFVIGNFGPLSCFKPYKQAREE
jgi:hypothetical protein